MLAWLQANFATVIVAALLVVAAAAALFFTLRSRKKGGSCSCGCGGCPYECKKKKD